MEPFLADLLLNDKLPNPLRLAIVYILTGFLFTVSIMNLIKTDSVIGKAVCALFTLFAVFSAVILSKKILKTKK